MAKIITDRRSVVLQKSPQEVGIVGASLVNSENKCGSRDDWQIVHAKTLEEIEAIREPWQRLQQKHAPSELSADIDRYISILAGRKSDRNPHVVMLCKQDRPICIAIGRVEKHQLPCKIGYKSIVTPSLKGLTIAHGGILGQLDKMVMRVLFQELVAVIDRGEVELVCLSHLNVDSIFYELGKTLPRYLSRGRFGRIDQHWSMTVPEDIDQFYKARTRTHRHNLRKKVRVFEKEFPERIRIVTYRHEHELEQAALAAQKVSSRTYQHGLGVGFVYDSALQSMLSTAAKKGWLRMSILYVDEAPCAFQLGFHYGNTYFLNQAGYDPDWGKKNVGTVLFIKLLEGLCADPSIHRFDFGFGDADYKRNYSDQNWKEESVYIFAPRFYPIAVNGLKSASSSLDSVVNSLLYKAGIRKKVKKLWRHCLRK